MVHFYLVKDKLMNIYAVISNEDLQSNIVNYIKLIKNINFSFVKLNEINNLKNKTVFFIIDSKIILHYQ